MLSFVCNVRLSIFKWAIIADLQRMRQIQRHIVGDIWICTRLHNRASCRIFIHISFYIHIYFCIFSHFHSHFILHSHLFLHFSTFSFTFRFTFTFDYAIFSQLFYIYLRRTTILYGAGPHNCKLNFSSFGVLIR